MRMDKEQLINDSIPFVYYIINKYYPTYRYNEDVIQAGMLGLVRAARHYQEEKGKFSTYAGVVIRNEIARQIKWELKENTVSLDAILEKQENGYDYYA